MGVDQLGGGGGYDRTLDLDNVGGASNISDDEQIVVLEEEIPDGATIQVIKARLSKPGGQAVASNLTLEIVEYDGAGNFYERVLIFDGDGSTVFENSGEPLAEFTNSTGGPLQVGVQIDNQSGGNADAIAMVKGKVVL